MVYRLEKEDDTIYASMDDYAAERVAELKKGTMTYSVSENNEYASRSIEDTVADVRVTQLEQGRFARQPLPRRHGAGAVVLPV